MKSDPCGASGPDSPASSNASSDAQSAVHAPEGPIPYGRLGLGGVFMGLANLVPGVSGGTMVLALGLYDEFVGAVADLTRLRVRLRALVVLAILVGLAGLTILGLSSVVQTLMETSLSPMLALFIGMTLGGAPLLHRQIRPYNVGATVGAAAGFVLMAVIAFALRPGGAQPSWGLFFLGGVIGSSAMILPGISGSYMLLIMGLYLPVIAGVSEFKEALKAMDAALLMDVGLRVVLPVGLGLVVGIVALSNVLEFLLARHRKPTLGFLIGLLVGSVLGLFPFKAPSFDKLPRHAVEQADGRRELRVMGFGFAREAGAPVFDALEVLAEDGCPVRWLDGTDSAEPSPEDVQTARREGAVMIAYDTSVSRAVRRAAADESTGAAVSLTIVPDTAFTPTRGAMVAVLILVGFGITFMLGRFDRSKAARPEATESAA